MADKTSADRQALAQRLKSEATADRPEFSDELHARIVGAVRQTENFRDRGKTPSSLLPDSSLRRFRWAFIGVAAACAVVVLTAAWWVGGRQVPQPGGLQPEAPVARGQPSEPLTSPDRIMEIADASSQRLTDAVDSVALDRWAYLDHDAKVALDMLTDPLPLGIASQGEL